MSEKTPEREENTSKIFVPQKLTHIWAWVCKCIIHIFLPRYSFPLEKILSEIPKDQSVTIRISVKNNTILEWVVISLYPHISEQRRVEIYLRDWIKKELREKIEIFRRWGKQISFIGGVRNNPEYGYTSIWQAMENIPLITGEVYDTHTGNIILYFQDIRIEWEEIFTSKKPSV